MALTKVSEKSPFGKELLARDDCFILDNGANGKVFVWKGEANCHLKFERKGIIVRKLIVRVQPYQISLFTVQQALFVFRYFTFSLV